MRALKSAKFAKRKNENASSTPEIRRAAARKAASKKTKKIACYVHMREFTVEYELARLLAFSGGFV